MIDLLWRKYVMSFAVVAWVIFIVSAIVWVWLENFGKTNMADAAMGGSVIALLGVALHNLRKVRGLE